MNCETKKVEKKKIVNFMILGNEFPKEMVNQKNVNIRGIKIPKASRRKNRRERTFIEEEK